ncbi:transposase [Micromonospora deserti]|uniref:transposase n=1 Tax=Micromonospora deserti TaxID=2070366 RepID=UPI0034DD743C
MGPAVRFATKPALGLRMLARALDAGVSARWVTADEAYGQDSKFRIELQQRRVGYVLAVPRSRRSPRTVVALALTPSPRRHRPWRGSAAAAAMAPKVQDSTTGPLGLPPVPRPRSATTSAGFDDTTYGWSTNPA